MKIKAYIILTRPVNIVISFLSILAGGFVTGRVDSIAVLFTAALSGSLIGAGGNVINDYFDVEIDRINKPFRPLPAGFISLRKALIFSIVLFSSGIIIGSLISFTAFVISSLAAISLFFYSYKLKVMALWGNITVAFISGMAFVYGGVVAGNYLKSIVVGGFAFFFHFAREIVKDCEDVEGDKSLGADTIPIRYGIRKAIKTSQIVIFVLIAFTISVYFFGIFKLPYLIAVILSVDLVLVYIMLSLNRDMTKENFARVSTIMKIDMLFGLIAVF
ncbi:geranylgeranylglycerol-phosphate geranylgeranyltransferase, partial [bacterium]|nr:geranylgeranylglycerol-phosphate geranylgeranyltransferase [bacterium]